MHHSLKLNLNLKFELKFKLQYAIFLIASIAYSTCAWPQNDTKPTTATASDTPATTCPGATNLTQQQAYGDWRVMWLDGSATEFVRFRLNPEFPDSLSGELQRGSTRLQLAGDLEDGELNLEESPDGKTISATWVGAVVKASCGKEIQGVWTRDEGVSGKSGAPAVRKFVLRRVTGW